MARLEISELQVDTFPTGPEGGEVRPQGETLWASTGYCCDTRLDCSAACRQPTNVCEVCG